MPSIMVFGRWRPADRQAVAQSGFGRWGGPHKLVGSPSLLLHRLFTKNKSNEFSWLFLAYRCSPRTRSICACRIA